jgi:hypothetical protein
MYKDYKRVKDGMNIGRGLSMMSRKGSGKGFLVGILVFAAMIAFIVICKKFGIM